MKYKNGFTLIEAIIYIALFSILIGGALVATYQLMQGADSLNSKKTLQEEGNFVLRKLDWALTGVKSFSIPNSRQIIITKDTGDTVEIKLLNNTIQMRENLGTFASTTTSNLIVNNLQFQSIGTNPLGIIATTTINGVDFVITKYIRK